MIVREHDFPAGSSVAFIADHEALADVRDDGLVYPYDDWVGTPTIGWGFTDKRLIRTAPHPRARMDRILVFTVWRFEREALRLSPILFDYSNARLAITSFCYNLGTTAYAGSTLRKKINAGQWRQAQYQIKRWKYAGGRVSSILVARRRQEAALLTGNNYKESRQHA